METPFMATQVIPSPDDAAAKSLAQSIAQIKANAAQYGASDAEMLALEAKVTAFSAELVNVENAKNARNGAVARKDAARTSLEKDYRALVQRIHANPAITDQQKMAAGIPAHDTVKSSVMPPAPTDLVVAPNANGTNYLAWNCIGAPSGTDYLIEAKPVASDTWTLVGSSHKLSFEHTGQKPGVGITYRVRSRRSKLESQPCTPVGAYL